MTETEWNSCTDPQRMMDFLLNWIQDSPGDRFPNLPPSDRKLRLFACACCRVAGPPDDDGQIDRYEECGHPDSGDDEWALNWAMNGYNLTPGIRASILRHILGPTPFRPAWSRKCERCRFSPREDVNFGCDACAGRGWLPVEACQRCVKLEENDARLAPSNLREERVGRARKRQGDGLGAGRHNSPVRNCDTDSDSQGRRINCRDRGCVVPHLPAAVVQLAQAIYDGQQDAAPVLHDALVEVGLEEIAEHFYEKPLRRGLCYVQFPDGAVIAADVGRLPIRFPRSDGPDIEGVVVGGQSHPRGCWAVDAILGKE